MTGPVVDSFPTSGLLTRSDGRVLSWRAEGPAYAPALLWLHGSTGSARTAPTTGAARVVSYDRPGYGASSFHDARDLVGDAEDIAALLDHLGIERTTVLAFSGGAAVAYSAAALLNDRVSHVGVVSGAAWPTVAPPPLDAVRAAGAALQADPEAAVDGLAVDAPDLDREVLADPVLRQSLVDGAVDAMAAGPDGWVSEAQLVRTTWPVSPQQVRVPVMLWHGEDDNAVTLTSAELTASNLPDAHLTCLARAGHLGWMAKRASIIQSLMAE